MITRTQLLELGMGAEAIRHRLRTGRLHRVATGVYAVGRPEVTQEGRWMAAVLVCGEMAMLSHRSAAALWRLLPVTAGPVDVAVPADLTRRRPEVRLHRKQYLGGAGPELIVRRVVRDIPVTDPVCTLVDVASDSTVKELEAAINEASHRDLVTPDSLRNALDPYPPVPGVGRLRRMLDREAFVLTDTELERRFLRIVRASRLPLPKGQHRLGAARVDFHWPELGLVVECDSLRYHRTAAKQTSDLRRDHEHIRAGRQTLRFSHYQVRYESAYVGEVLETVILRICGTPKR